jgi:hypothetical protein
VAARAKQPIVERQVVIAHSVVQRGRPVGLGDLDVDLLLQQRDGGRAVACLHGVDQPCVARDAGLCGVDTRGQRQNDQE